MPTTEDWIAIATIVTGSAVAISAVFLGYWLQLRAMRRDRFANLASTALANAYRLCYLAYLLARAYEARKLINGWPASPSPEQVKGVVQPLMVVRTGLGVSSASILVWTDPQTRQPTEPQVRATVVEDVERATRALDNAIETTRKDSMAMVLTGYASWAKPMVVAFADDLYADAINTSRPDGLDPEVLFAKFIKKLSEIEVKFSAVTS